MPLEEQLSMLFDSHLKILNALLDDLKENVSLSVGDGSTLEFFWTKICLATQTLSKDATNLCMMFSAPPLPTQKECEPVVRKLERTAVAVVSIYYSLPQTCGATLRREVHCAVNDTVNAVVSLGQTISINNFNVNKEQLQRTGSVWECCDKFPNLPHDNASAVLHNMRLWQGLVNDALQEMEESLQEADHINESDNSCDDFMMDVPTWSEDDRQLIGPALGLVKASRATLKKSCILVKSKAGSQVSQQVVALDELNERLRRVSPGVDEVVSCLYPPIDHGILRQNVTDLSSLMDNTLSYIRRSGLSSESDESWLDFLSQAIQHNRDKLYEVTPGN